MSKLILPKKSSISGHIPIIKICVPRYLPSEQENQDMIEHLLCYGLPGYHIKMAKSALTLIEDWRNDVTLKDMEFDYQLMIDSDMVFPIISWLERNLPKCLDVIGGLCFKRKAPHTPNIARFDSKGNPVTLLTGWENLNLFEVDCIGAGVLLIKRKVFYDLKGSWGKWFRRIPIPNDDLNLWGEDWSFCIRVREKGLKIWCDREDRIGHISKQIISEADYMVYKDEFVEHFYNDKNLSEERRIEARKIFESLGPTKQLKENGPEPIKEAVTV